MCLSQQPMMSKSMLAAFGSSRGASPQLFRPVYSSWSTQPGRPHTSFEVHSDFWARSSTPGFSVPASPDVGAMRKSRRRPAAPPGRVSVSPNMSSPGEPAFVSQLVDNGVSRLDGPLRETVSQMDTAFMRIHELLRSHEATEVEARARSLCALFFFVRVDWHRSDIITMAYDCAECGRDHDPEGVSGLGSQAALRSGHLGYQSMVP